jgi:hypothetical protein
MGLSVPLMDSNDDITEAPNSDAFTVLDEHGFGVGKCEPQSSNATHKKRHSAPRYVQISLGIEALQ